MPTPLTIHIERKPNNRLEPQGAFRQRIPAGGTVAFGLVAPLTGLVVRFKNGSPFTATTIHYGEVHTVTAPFDAVHPEKNIYKFDCEDPNATGNAPSVDGGEMEVLPSS
jgi:hypothetical protein